MSESEGGSLTIIIAGNRISRFYRRGGGGREGREGGRKTLGGRTERSPNFRSREIFGRRGGVYPARRIGTI
jgi:hypothetical protein